MKMLNVYWTVNSNAKVEMGIAKSILSTSNLSTLLMRDVSDRLAVRRGINEMQNRRVITGDRRISEKIREDREVAVFGILHNVNDKAAEITAYSQDTKVTLNKNDGKISIEGTLSDEVKTAIDANRGFYNDADIRTLCLNVVRSIGGISKRPSGGVYILPAIFSERIENLRIALNMMVGDSAKLYVERIYDGEEEYRNIADSVLEDLSKRVEKVMVAVSNISKQSCRLVGHKYEVKELKNLTDVYSSILGDQKSIQDLMLKLTDAENTIADAIEKASVNVEIA